MWHWKIGRGTINTTIIKKSCWITLLATGNDKLFLYYYANIIEHIKCVNKIEFVERKFQHFTDKRGTS